MLRPSPALPCLVLAALGVATAAAQNRPPAQLAAELCAGCLGPALTGGTGPNVFTDKLKHGNDDASLLRAIRDGFPQQGMAGFAVVISEQEQTALVLTEPEFTHILSTFPLVPEETNAAALATLRTT